MSRSLIASTVLTSFLFGAIAFGALSCATTPNDADQKKAQGHYEVALALVHEAQTAASAGDDQTQDIKYREALRELLEADKLGGLRADGNYLLAVVYFVGFGRHKEAEAHLTKAIVQRKEERDEEYPEAENLMGNVFVASKRPKEALPHFERARSNLLYATPYFAEQGKGEALLALGKHDEAAQHFQRAIVAQPDLCGAYLKLAEVEVTRGDDLRAQRVLGDFFERCDSERLRGATGPRLLAPALVMLADSKLRSGDRDAAAQALRSCVERFKPQPIAKECDSRLAALEAG
jgi:tetratricopeptide (TPR) repeat protein